MENLSGQCYNDECCSKGKGNEKCSTRSSSSNGSNNRRKSRWDQPEANHSTGSLLSTMEKFVQSVDDMNETILVPCRLMDLQFDDTVVTEKNSGFVSNSGAAGSKPDEGRILSNLNGIDLYQFYSVLNNIKNDLMWGRKSQQTTIPINPAALSNSSSAASVISSVSSSAMTTSTTSSASLSNGEVKGHARRPSTVSTTSSSASDTEFSELNEDSGVEAEHEDDCAQSVADAFHHHLNGLQQCLCDLTIAADYVTNRYNSALGGF